MDYVRTPGHIFVPQWFGTVSSYTIQPYDRDGLVSILRKNGDPTRGIRVTFAKTLGGAPIWAAWEGRLRKAYHFPLSSMTFSHGGGALSGPYEMGFSWIYHVMDSDSDTLKWTVPVDAACIGMSRLVLECYANGDTPATRFAKLTHKRGSTSTDIGEPFYTNESVDTDFGYLPYDFDLGEITLQAGDELIVRKAYETGGSNVFGVYAYDDTVEPADDDEWDISYDVLSGTNPYLGDKAYVLQRYMALEGPKRFGAGDDGRWGFGSNHSVENTGSNCSASSVVETINGDAITRDTSWIGEGDNGALELRRTAVWTNTALSLEVCQSDERYLIGGSGIQYRGRAVVSNACSLTGDYHFECGMQPGDSDELYINGIRQSSLYANDDDQTDLRQISFYQGDLDTSLVMRTGLTTHPIRGSYSTGSRVLPKYLNDSDSPVSLASGDVIEWGWELFWIRGRAENSFSLIQIGEHSVMNYGSR